MQQTNAKVNHIILADDHHLVRDGIKSLLSKYSDIKVVGEASEGKEVLHLLGSTDERIDLILADISMPELNGIELLKQIKQQYPAIRVMFLSMLDHEKYISQALNEGAGGYLLKSVSEDELIFSVRQVVKGTIYVCTELTSQLLFKCLNGGKSQFERASPALDLEFSSREIEVLELIADGFTNQEIADKLFTSKRTIEGHRLQMIQKTGVRNTAALIKFCIKNGLLSI
ncbi:Oxygen regulatory protein NreC [compost metagenome]